MGFKKFVSEKGGWILAILSSIGVVTTSILSADEAPKAKHTREYITGLAQIYWDRVVKIVHPYIYRTGII